MSEFDQPPYEEPMVPPANTPLTTTPSPYYVLPPVRMPKIRKAFPSFGGAIGLLGILLAVSAMGGFVLGVLLNAFPDIQAPGFMVLYVISFVLTLWLGLVFRRNNKFSKRAGPWYLWPLLIAFTLLFLIVRAPFLTMIPMPADPDTDLVSGLNNLNPFMIIVTVLAAPFFEELIFRGIILDGFLKRYSPWKSILLSALIFGAAHLNPPQFVNGFLLGVLMGWIYWKTGSLLLTMLIHFINNGAAVLMAYLSGEALWGADSFFTGTLYMILLYISSLLLAIIMAFVIVYLTKRYSLKKNIEVKEELNTVVLQ